MTVAARGVGMTKASAYRLRARQGAESFAAAWDRAQSWGQDRMIDVGLEIALCGEQVPVMRDGRCVGIVHRHNNRLALAVLNAMDRRAARRALSHDPVQAFERALAALRPNLTPTGNKGFSPPT